MDRSTTVEYLKQVASIGGEKLKKDFLDIVKNRSFNNINETEFSKALTCLFKQHPVLIENLIPLLPSFTRQVLSQMNNLRCAVEDHSFKSVSKFDYEKAKKYVQLVREHFESDKTSFEKFQQLLNGVKLNAISFLESAGVFGRLFCYNPEFIEGFASFLKEGHRTKLYQVAFAVRQLSSYQLFAVEHYKILNELLDYVLYNRQPSNMLATIIGSQTLKITADSIPTLYLPKKSSSYVRSKKRSNNQESADGVNGVGSDGTDSAKRFGKSYIEVSLENNKHRSMTSSGRTSLCDSVINDDYMVVPNGSESYFKSSLKNPHEEILFLIEDDAYELDMLIGRAHSTIRMLEGLILQLKKLNKNKFLIITNENGTSVVRSEASLLEMSIKSYHELTISKIVKDRITGTNDLITQLKAQPGLYLNEIVKKIKLQLEDYVLLRKFFGNIWRESIVVHYQKSKNVQPASVPPSIEEIPTLPANAIIAEISRINYEVIKQGRLVDYHLQLNFSNFLQLENFNLYLNNNIQLEMDYNLIFEDIVTVLGSAVDEKLLSEDQISWFRIVCCWLVKYKNVHDEELCYYGSKGLLVIIRLLSITFSKFLLAKKLSQMSEESLWDTTRGKRPLCNDDTFLELSLSYKDLLHNCEAKKAMIQNLQFSSNSPFACQVRESDNVVGFEYDEIDSNNVQTDRVFNWVQSRRYSDTFEGDSSAEQAFDQNESTERQACWLDRCSDVPCSQDSTVLSQVLVDQVKSVVKSINYISCFNREENCIEEIFSAKSERTSLMSPTQKYKKWLELVTQIHKDSISEFEYDDWCLRLLGTASHSLGTLPKILSFLVNQIKQYFSTHNCKIFNSNIKDYFATTKYLKTFERLIEKRTSVSQQFCSLIDVETQSYITEFLKLDKIKKIFSTLFAAEDNEEFEPNPETLAPYFQNLEFLKKISHLLDADYCANFEADLEKDEIYYCFRLFPLGRLLIKSVFNNLPQYTNPIHAWKMYIKSYFTRDINKLNVCNRKIFLPRNIRALIRLLSKDEDLTASNVEYHLNKFKRKFVFQHLSQCRIDFKTYQIILVADSEDFLYNTKKFINIKEKKLLAKKSNHQTLSSIVERLTNTKQRISTQISDELERDRVKFHQEISNFNDSFKTFCDSPKSSSSLVEKKKKAKADEILNSTKLFPTYNQQRSESFSIESEENEDEENADGYP